MTITCSQCGGSGVMTKSLVSSDVYGHTKPAVAQQGASNPEQTVLQCTSCSGNGKMNTFYAP